MQCHKPLEAIAFIDRNLDIAKERKEIGFPDASRKGISGDEILVAINLLAE